MSKIMFIKYHTHLSFCTLGKTLYGLKKKIKIKTMKTNNKINTTKSKEA